MRYPWKRFWCPRNGAINLSDGGFLYDPESEYAKWVASDVVSFDAIANLPCIALLGEPGIGKSTAMGDLQDALKASMPAGHVMLCLNLNEYGDESRLIRDLFESDTVKAWACGQHVLHLFLDSLDECRLRIPQVATLVVNRLGQWSSHLSRLKLRIACRTADWPATFEQSLPELWGKDAYAAYELVPLRRKDIRLAAEAQHVDPDALVAELYRTDTVPLAIKPVTLTFLLSVFAQQGRLPQSRRELYDSGCTMLCDEPNPNRRDQQMHGAMSVSHRLAVASRIAAVSMLCRKPTIATGPVPQDMTTDEVHLPCLAGGTEPVGSDQLAVSEDSIRETLRTGLFSSRGPHRMGFSHQTYAEFLAARYLATHQFDAATILSLLRHPDDSDGRLVPQLYETAGWASDFARGILTAIAKCDPQVLLRGDTDSLDDAARRLIIDALLTAMEERRASDRDWDLHRHYGKLSHATLAEQLRPWLLDKTKSFAARYVAIDIAEACRCEQLQSVLADVALDHSEVAGLRDNAAHAIASIGDADTRSRLLPLALGQAGEDPQDQLKGNAMRALWPKLMTTEDMFSCLTLPKRDNFHGAYMNFLWYEMPELLQPADLPYALRWLTSLVSGKRLSYTLDQMANSIVVKAWQNMEDESVLDALAELSVAHFKQYHDLIRDNRTLSSHPELFDSIPKRRRLAGRIAQISQDQHTRFELTGRSPRLIRSEDFDWCIEQLVASVGSPPESLWAELAWSLFCWGEPDSGLLDQILHARELSPALNNESEVFFTPVDLGSERATRMKKEFYDAKKWQRKPRKRKLKSTPRERIEHWLNQSEHGEPKAFWVLMRDMTLEETSTEYGLIPADIRKLPGWQNANASTRQRISAAAERFLLSVPVDPMKWLREPHSWGHFHVAGYKALFLLKQEVPNVYESLPASAWQRHVPTVLCSPCFDRTDWEEEQHEEIGLRCYQQAKQAVLFYLPLQLDAEDRTEQGISCERKLEGCWDNDLKHVVYEKVIAARGYWRPKSFEHVTFALLSHGYEPMRKVFVDQVQAVTDGTCDNQEYAQIAAAGLIAHSEDAAWSTIWPAVLANRDFGRNLLMSVAHGSHRNTDGIASKLSDSQLADLFIWLVHEFPYSEDREHDGVHSPDKDDSVRELRDGIVRFLEARGTIGAVAALQAASASLPQLEWLASVVVEARKNTLRKTWIPLEPSELLALAAKPTSALVRNADELQSLILDALSVLEQRLQGETPQAFALWDQVDRTRGQEKYRPKDENHLSDWIKSNLELELASRSIVIARELEIRRGEGQGTGERTDIHVTAVIPGVDGVPVSKVSVIVEAKGCWNPDLQIAMRSQLVDRYLKDNPCRHGIFLVGWYMCEQWDNSHSQRKATPAWSIEDARTFFTSQAKEMPSDVTIQAIVLDTRLR